MVLYSDLDRIFGSLANPTRRALVKSLDGNKQVSVSELARSLHMSLPAVTKHLNVLEDAGLVHREKRGRVVACRLNATPMQYAVEWLNHYEKFWSSRFDKMVQTLEDDHGQ